MQARPVQGPELPVPGQTLGIPIPPVAGAAPHAMPPGQAMPQSRVPPQPSPMTPQYRPPPAGVQLPGTQLGSPHTPATPRPPQLAGDMQAPQSSIPPQPSPTTPQKRDPAGLQVSGTHPAPATHSPEPLHTWAPAQPPQSMARPQPFPTVPQYFPVATWQASGWHSRPATHTPRSQISLPGHEPQSMVPRQPSPMTPQ